MRRYGADAYVAIARKFPARPLRVVARGALQINTVVSVVGNKICNRAASTLIAPALAAKRRPPARGTVYRSHNSLHTGYRVPRTLSVQIHPLAMLRQLTA
jgi:hypothetical protein